MQRSFIFILFLCICKPGFAQITINQADMSATADTLRVSIGTLPGVFNPAQTGANFTWNFSGLIPMQQRVETFVTVASTPAFYQFVFNLPFGNNKATIAYKEPEFTIPGGTGGTIPVISDYYSFFKNSVSDYRKIGFGVTLNSAPVPVAYNNPEVIYKFPLAFNNRDSSDFSFILNIPNTLYYAQAGRRVNKTDGWGTLTTPFGTFQTLRVVSRITAKDTISQDTTLSFAFDRPLTREYKWLAKTHKIPVLTIITTEINGVETVTAAIYRDIYRNLPGITLNNAEIKENNEITVFPNPFTTQLIIGFTNKNSDPARFEITDALGRILYEKTLKSAGGKQLIEINERKIQMLKPGIYYLHLYNGDESIIRKITKID